MFDLAAAAHFGGECAELVPASVLFLRPFPIAVFHDASLLDLLKQGGLTTLVLAVLSVLSVALMFVLWMRLGATRARDADRLTADVLRALHAGDGRGALDACQRAEASVFGRRVGIPLGRVFAHMLESRAPAGPALQQVALARLDRETLELERGLAWLGTLGAVAPFIGLFGTVIGVIRAFDALGAGGGAGGGMGGGGFGPLMSAIAEALVATGAGLLVAIPAVVAYNHFRRRVRTHTLVAEQGIAELDAVFQASAAHAPSSR